MEKQSSLIQKNDRYKFKKNGTVKFEGYIRYNHQVAYKKRKKILPSLIDAIAFLGQATNYKNQVRWDKLSSRLWGRMKKLVKN